MKTARIRVASAIAVAGILATAGVSAALGGASPPPNEPTIAALDEGAQSSGPEALATNCRKSYTSGAGLSKFSWCFSDDGNITMLENSAGLEHVFNGIVTEGWCVSTDGVKRGQTDGSNANFNLDSPIYTTSTKVAHRTSDGLLRVESGFGQSPANNKITVTMKVRNLSPNTVNSVFLTRFIDADLANTTGDDVWASASRSVSVTEPGVARLELIPQTTGFTANSMIYPSFVPVNNEFCYDPASDSTLEAPASDRSMGVLYQLGSIAPGTDKTVKFSYRISI